jgi:cyclopropane-fatty-acyl-phospholipid synthase
MAVSLPAGRANLFNEIFAGYNGPPFAVRLWEGSAWRTNGDATPACTIVIKKPTALAALIAAPNEITLGEAFIREELDVEGDLFSAFEIAEHLFSRPQSLRHRIAQRAAATFCGLRQLLSLGAAGSRRRDRASIAYHYDQPVEFFQPWLGPTLAYSCAYFRHTGQSLDEAQRQKLELVCTKLRLRPGEHFLDIGCGWGSLPLHAAQRHGARAHGVTLSREQAATATRRIQRAGLNGCCAVELSDYRDLARNGHAFDKIASIGMFEHVGLKNLSVYFGIARKLLRPGGLMLNHGIARASAARVPRDSFISRYVFPGGWLVTLPEALAAAEQQGLEVRDVENLREHYELTLRCWATKLRANAESLLQLVPTITYRIWLLYLAGSAAAFRRGDIGVYQVLLSRPDQGVSGLPLTREDWYNVGRASGEAREPQNGDARATSELVR